MEEEKDTDHKNGAKCTLQAHSVCACVCVGGQHLIDKSTNHWSVSLLLEVTSMISNAGQECILMLPSANIYTHRII